MCFVRRAPEGSGAIYVDAGPRSNYLDSAEMYSAILERKGGSKIEGLKSNSVFAVLGRSVAEVGLETLLIEPGSENAAPCYEN